MVVNALCESRADADAMTASAVDSSQLPESRLPESLGPGTEEIFDGAREQMPERIRRFESGLRSQPSAVIGEELDGIVGAAARGDRSALARVLEIVRPPVVRYCRGRIGFAERGQISADDVAQEVCLAVVTALPRYRDQGRPFMSFVYGIASHKVADARRNAARDKTYATAEVPEVACTDYGPEQRALESEDTRQMNTLLATLPEKTREILVLRLVVGLSAEETATVVGSTAGAVRVAQHRALAKLRVLAQAGRIAY